MKKRIVIIAGVFAVISIVLCLNVFVRQKSIQSSTYAELQSRGYEAADIRSIAIDHSYLRRALGYNEWRIAVEFAEKSDVFFWFTYRDNRILFEGVSSEPMMDVETMIEYSEKFKNGTLLDESE